MKIKRVMSERFHSYAIHPWFNANQDVWERCRCGEEVEVPDEHQAEIKALFGNTIEISSVEVIKPTKGKAKPEPKVVEEGEI